LEHFHARVYQTVDAGIAAAAPSRHPNFASRASPLEHRLPPAFMNIHKSTLAILVLIVVAVFFYERNQTHEVQASLESLAKDRDSLKRQVGNLSKLVDEAKERESTPPSSVEAPRVPPAVASTPVQRVEEPPVPGVTRVAPAGWSKNGSKPGSYVVGIDQNQSFGGMPSAYVKSVDSSIDGFGGMMQMSSPDEFAGKRVRMSGWVKTEDANDGGGHLWLRVDGQQSGQMLQFDNMDNRAVKGTTDWQQYSVVVDVPPDSAALAYGFFVSGTGKMWVSGTKMEAVGSEVASTNMLTNNRARSLPKTPVNLSFDPNHPK
jgi:hypothetical protein